MATIDDLATIMTLESGKIPRGKSRRNRLWTFLSRLLTYFAAERCHCALPGDRQWPSTARNENGAADSISPSTWRVSQPKPILWVGTNGLG